MCESVRQKLGHTKDFLHTFSMALYHKWDVNVLTFLSLIFDGLGTLIKKIWSNLTYKQRSSWIYRSAGTPLLVLSTLAKIIN